MRNYSSQCSTNISIKIGGKTELFFFLINLFIFRGLRGKGLNPFLTSLFWMGSFTFKNVYIITISSRKTSIDHVLSEEKTKSILPASQYIMILLYPVISRNKVSSCSVIQTCSWRFLFYFVLFIIIQILILVCKINRIAVNSPRVHDNFLLFRLQLWASLVFSVIHGFVLIYVHFWSNLLFTILTSLLLISIFSC